VKVGAAAQRPWCVRTQGLLVVGGITKAPEHRHHVRVNGRAWKSEAWIAHGMYSKGRLTNTEAWSK